MEAPVPGSSDRDSRFLSGTSGLPRPASEESYPYSASRSQGNTAHAQYEAGRHDVGVENNSQQERSRRITYYPSASSQKGATRIPPSTYANMQDLTQSNRTPRRDPLSSPREIPDRIFKPYDRPGRAPAQSYSARSDAGETNTQGRPQKSVSGSQENLYPTASRPPVPPPKRPPLEGHWRSSPVEKSADVCPTLADPMVSDIHAAIPNGKHSEPKPGFRRIIREMAGAPTDKGRVVCLLPKTDAENSKLSTGKINLGFVASDPDPNSRYQNIPAVVAKDPSSDPRYQNVPAKVTANSKVGTKGHGQPDHQQWGRQDRCAGQERKSNLRDVVMDNSIAEYCREVSGRAPRETRLPGAVDRRQDGITPRPTKSSRSFGDSTGPGPASPGETTRRFVVWLGLALFATLGMGWIPGFVALVYIWQARAEWEDGRKDKSRRLLRIGQLCLLVSLLVGVACWAAIGYVIYRQSQPQQDGGARGDRPWLQYGDLLDEQRKSNLFWSQRQGPDPAG